MNTTQKYMLDLLYSYHNIKPSIEFNSSRFMQNGYSSIITTDAIAYISRHISMITDEEQKKNLIYDLYFNYTMLHADAEGDRDLDLIRSLAKGQFIAEFCNNRALASHLVDAFFEHHILGDYLDLSEKGQNIVNETAFKLDKIEVKSLDELVSDNIGAIKAFFESKKLPSHITISLMSLGIFYSISISAPVGIESSFNFLAAYKEYIIVMLYAEVYAMLVSGRLEVDDWFRTKFDEHASQDDYSIPEDKEYTYKLLVYYFEAIELKKKYGVSEDIKNRVRQINPLYY